MQRRRICRDRLVDWVIKRLEKGWTPQEISGRLAIEFPSDTRMRVSTEIIYAWIYAPAQQHRQLWQYLPLGAKKLRRRACRRVHSERIKCRMSIHKRPAEVSDRSQFGHWEIRQCLGVHGTGAPHTTVECVSRYLCAAKIPGATAQATLDAQLAVYARSQPMLLAL